MVEIELNERAKVQVDRQYKLTAVVLVYNGGRYLRPCIESLVNQTIDDLEILLINDASTDDSLSICIEYEREYDNVFIIDKKENGGLASSANLGIQLAKGEYVILVDNDDVVPEYAYEKLYNKAKENDADISIGQAILLHNSVQHEINGVEQMVWEEERVVDDINDFPTIFHDAFYWNKIIKKSLLVENGIELPDGMIYADRKFSHTAFIHAKTITIIPDCVYLWRIRKNDKNDESLSIRRKEAWNYINRIDSYEMDLDKIIEKYPDYFKILMKRVIVPIKGINESKEFENTFYERGVKLLKEETPKVNDLYNNDLSNLENLYLFLALNDYRDELNDLLKLNISDQREIFNEDGKSYWKLPLFRNSDLEVPDELFEIKMLTHEFLNIEKVSLTRDLITFEGIEFPKHLKFDKAEILLVGRCGPSDVLIDNTFSFEIEKDDDNERNTYGVEIKTSDLRLFELYDVFIKVYYENRAPNEFRLSNKIIEEIENTNDEVMLFATAYNKLSVAVQKLDQILTIKTDEDGVTLLVNDSSQIKKYLRAMFIDLNTKEEVFFTLNDDLTEFFLEWEFFLDIKSEYSLNFKMYNEDGKYSKRSNINIKHLKDFKEHTVTTSDNVKVKVSKNSDGNIRFISS